MFDLKYRDVLPMMVGDEFDSFGAQLRGFSRQEHNTDGSHANITAETLSLQGAGVGEVVDLAYDSARYIQSGGTSWTVSSGDQVYLRSSRIGQLIFIQFYVQTTVIVGTPSYLIIRLPEMHAIPNRNALPSPAGQFVGMCEWFDYPGSLAGIGQVEVIADSFSNAIPFTSIQLRRYGNDATDVVGWATWPASTDFWIHGSGTFFAQPNNRGLTFFGL